MTKYLHESRQARSHAGEGADESAKLGQPVTVQANAEGSQLQVTAKKITATKPTDHFTKVEKGKRLVAVQFQLVDTGLAPYNDAPSNEAVVIDAKSQQYDADPFLQDIAAGPLLPTPVKIAPKNKALGFLTFQVPKNAKIAQVQFSMDSGFGDTAQWNVR